MAEVIRYRVKSIAHTDVGRVRSVNEDSFFVANLTKRLRLESSGIIRFVSGLHGSLFAVADGMGGVAGGRTASRLGIRTLYKEVQALVEQSSEHDEESLEAILIQAVGLANSRIFEMGRKNHKLGGMGTTLTIVLERFGRLIIGQVGDSRAYLLREDGIRQLTQDQSLVAQMVSAGQLTEEQARYHPERNILLQALGVQSEVELDLRRITIQAEDIILLCSDGLHSLLRSGDLLDVVVNSNSLDNACVELVDLANSRGGLDNITVVLSHFAKMTNPKDP